MNKAEEFFWENLPKHNLTSQNVIDRERVNFDDIIELMNKYAQQVNRGVAIKFIKDMDIEAETELLQNQQYEAMYDNWQNKQ